MRSDVMRRRRAIKRRFLAVLRGQLGYSEGPNNTTKFGAWYGLNNQPWCAMFVSWCAWRAEVRPIVPRHAYTPAGANWYKARGRWGSEPRVGAIAYYDLAGLGRISHVGVVERVLEGGAWYSLEGNTNAAGSRTGGSVRRQTRTRVGRLGGFGYPDYTAQARAELEAERAGR